jgi:membrane fusion protein, multidrug efflux system
MKNKNIICFFLLTVPGLSVFASESDAGQLSCLLEPSKEINLATQVQGVVKRVKVERGGEVSKGQVVITLETGLETAMLNLAKAKVEFSKRKVERNKELIDTGILTAHEADEIQTEHTIFELEMIRAEKALQQKIIYSPVNAIVVERLVSKGEYAGVEPLLKLAVLNPLHAQVVMKADFYGLIEKGQEVEIMAQGKTDVAYTGKVKIVDKIIDAASNTFGVIVEIPNPDFNLPAGLKCRIHYLSS